MTPYIIPIFITHQGCPQRCIFCNQNVITGQSTVPLTPKLVSTLIQEGLQRKRKAERTETQVAFYGGTFTGLDSALQEEILSSAAKFCETGQIDSIRISTRPDYIDAEKIGLLRRYGVRIIELGAQSMIDEVLANVRRGHSAADTLNAMDLLKRAGFQVGVQIMIGLPGESRGALLSSLDVLLSYGPEFVRLYPTLVLRGTVLAEMYVKGEYQPLELQKAVELCRDIFSVCRKKGTKIIRMGLQTDSSLEQNLVAGPYHQAFGHLVMAQVLKKKILAELESYKGLAVVDLWVAPSATSLLTGFRGRVLNDIHKQTGILHLNVRVEKSLTWEEVRVSN